VSPTSSEPGAPGPLQSGARPGHHGGVHPEGEGTRRAAEAGRRLRQQRELKSFQRLFWILTGVLTAVSAVFLLLGTLQGPKLATAQVDPQRVTEQAGQQLRLFANQPLREVDPAQVTVEPDAPVSVVVQNDLLVVQFEQRLRYDTEYTVVIEDVAARSRDAVSTFSHSFSTGGGSLLYLDRGEEQDEILRAEISGSGRGELVHAAPGIQSFAPVEEVLVVARDDGAGGSVLESVLTSTGDTERLRLPDGARVDRLIAPPSGTLLGLVLTEVVEEGTPAYSNALAVVNLAGDRSVTFVEGLDGDPIRALEAFFRPDGTTLYVHALDQSLLRVDLLSPDLVLPVDQFPTVWNLSTDATRLSGADSFGGLYLDLESGEEVRLNPSLFEGSVVFGGETVLLGDERWVQKVAVPDASGGSFASIVVVDDGSGASRQLARTIEDRGSIGDLAVSPNDQFVALEVTPSVEDAESDGRRVNDRPTTITVQIIDIDSGAIVRSLEGFFPVW